MDEIVETDNDIEINTDNFNQNKKDKCEISKFDILLLNHGWNDRNEKLVASIGENAASYKWMHEKASYRYKIFERVIGIVIVILNAILSAETTFNNNANESTDIVIKVVIYIVTIVSVVNNFLNFQQTYANHHHAIRSFSELYHEIQEQMCLYRKDRQNAVKYIQHVMKKYDSLNDISPPIPEDILKDLNKKYKNSDISIPDTAGRIHKIDIITQPQPQSFNALMTPNVQNTETTPSDLELGIRMTNYNPLHINGDITENDARELSEYLKRESNNAQVRFEFDRWGFS
jgi:hypothetical protein